MTVTGGGLHGKDLSKADVSVNIYAWLKAQAIGKPVELSCAIGDREIDSMPYSQIVDSPQSRKTGGFEVRRMGVVKMNVDCMEYKNV